MIISVGLAGGGAFYFAKANIEQDSFSQAITRITQNTDATWCDIAKGQIIDSQSGAKFCAIHMPEYAAQEEGPE